MKLRIFLFTILALGAVGLFIKLSHTQMHLMTHNSYLLEEKAPIFEVFLEHKHF